MTEISAHRITTEQIRGDAADVLTHMDPCGWVTPPPEVLRVAYRLALLAPEVAEQRDAARAEAEQLRALCRGLDAADREKAEELLELRAERDEARARLRAASMVRCWTNEDGKRFVFADDLLAAIDPEAAADASPAAETTPDEPAHDREVQPLDGTGLDVIHGDGEPTTTPAADTPCCDQHQRCHITADICCAVCPYVLGEPDDTAPAGGEVPA